MRISNVHAREILDSRGNPTIEVELHSEGISAIASAPSGASTGKFEALELRDNEKRYHGKGVKKAVRNVNMVIKKALRGKNFESISEFDSFLIELDGTPNKSKLGANATVACSICFAKLLAMRNNKDLYQLLGKKPKLPLPFANVINGGKHAGNSLAIQEFMLVPVVKQFSERVRLISETYHTLKEIIKSKYGPSSINVGDEGGFAPNISSCTEALDLLARSVEKSGHTKEFRIAIDSAASSFYRKGTYHIDGKRLNKDQLLEYYLNMIRDYNIFSIEDPFQEEDFDSFSELLKKVKQKCRIVGDDLTVTNLERVKNAMQSKSIDTLLLKVNQIGTLSEALESADYVKKMNGEIIVSHRSGETEDTYIADIATGISALGIKLGAPARGERTAKYNRLLRIEEKLETRKLP